MGKRRVSPPRLPKWEYQDYINSPEWRAKRQDYFNSKLPQKCLVCNSKKVDLHHRTYKRLGSEWLNDLVPLCREHHNECHSFIKRNKLNLWGGTKIYVRVAKERLLTPEQRAHRDQMKAEAAARRVAKRAKNKAKRLVRKLGTNLGTTLKV
jgi:hypothetical protein